MRERKKNVINDLQMELRNPFKRPKDRKNEIAQG
jgi:hypothetical protein